MITQIQCSTIKLNKNYAEPVPRPSYLTKRYAVPDGWHVLSNENTDGGSFLVKVALPEIGGAAQTDLILNYFPCREEGKQPAILVSPIFGGKNSIAEHFARFFSERGYHALVVHRPVDLMKDTHDLEVIDEQLRRAVIRDRVALEWLLQQPEVDENRLGSFGISYGGIKNSILAGIEPRLKANIFALAGGDLASIFMESTLENLDELRAGLMQEKGVDEREAEALIRRTVRTEPLRYAPYVDARTTLLFLARFDDTVPTQNGELLRAYMGYPKTIYLPAGHFTAAAFTSLILSPYVENECVRFFDQHLQMPM